jgi:hypothetical protein
MAGSTVIGLPAAIELTPYARPWKIRAQALGLNLKQRLRIRKARQAMPTETAEPDAGRRRCPHRGSRRGGDDHLTAVSGRADPRGGVNR